MKTLTTTAAIESPTQALPKKELGTMKEELSDTGNHLQPIYRKLLRGRDHSCPLHIFYAL